MITDDEKIYLIETANRGGGCFTSEIIMPAVSDVDILSQYICDSIGEKQNFYNDLISKNQVILKFFSFNSGKLIDIKGIDKMGANPNILKFKILVEKGDKISKVTTDADRHAFIIFKYKGDNIRSEVE
ncbi:MAG: ATP-dependent carboxylate-amine ligase, partial [Deltaproteobacteria bacterium]|nr:ATP-dependent carboxylate-amine ligase [Deltaproteobacteria bacterium]